MKLKFFAAFAVFALFFLLIGCAQSNPPPAGNGTTPPSDGGTTPPAGETKTVEITASGFAPNALAIKAGDTVNFVNRDSVQHWPASAQHPTHEAYPEPGGCIGSKFDACKGLAQGETFSFTFNFKGKWNYHDHLNAQAPFFGSITVE